MSIETTIPARFRCGYRESQHYAELGERLRVRREEEEARQPGLRLVGAVPATVREHEATRYERQLRIPASSAYTHRPGSHWQPEQMCPDQWRQLGEIRARDRERKRRTRKLVTI